MLAVRQTDRDLHLSERRSLSIKDRTGRTEVSITVDDLKTNSKFRGVLFLDMDAGAYENHYESQTYPRLKVIKSGGPRVGKGQKNYTTYFVDGRECADLDTVLARLNAEPIVNIGAEQS
jgi:hypothetical protein